MASTCTLTSASSLEQPAGMHFSHPLLLALANASVIAAIKSELFLMHDVANATGAVCLDGVWLIAVCWLHSPHCSLLALWLEPSARRAHLSSPQAQLLDIT